MSNQDPHDQTLPYAIPAGDDQEIARLISSWRYRGPQVPWDAIVGHGPQITRCRELVEKLRRSADELALLRIRVGAGLVISGPAGVGKSLMARALATALDRDVIVPPTGELTAATIRRLYAQLAKDDRPVLVLLDEAESLIGQSWRRSAELDVLNAFLDALDGIGRPANGPITVALTTLGLEELDEAAVRPGRLAPRLLLEKPTAEERRLLLDRLIDGLLIVGELDLETVVDRTGDWSGAELAGAVQDACSRSLLDHTDALRQDLLLQVVAERYNIIDEAEEIDWHALERIALHEAGHVIYAWLTIPGGLASVKLYGHHGETRLHDSVARDVLDAQGLRRHAELSLAGSAAELVCRGPALMTEGGHRDKERATDYLLRLLALRKPYDTGTLEAGNLSDHGSERMRAGWHAELEALAAEAQESVVRWLSPHGEALVAFSRILLEAPEHSLSGDALQEAIRQVMPRPVASEHGGQEG